MGFKLRSKTNCGGVDEPPCPDPNEASKTRKGETVYVDGKPGKYTFHEKPLYKGQKKSSHLMADDGKNQAWPSITRDTISGSWSNQSQKQASDRNELYKFKNTDRMINFARKGNWKNQNNTPFKNLNRWFKEKWETPKGNKDYTKGENTFRPTKKVSSSTPKTWSEVTPASKAKAQKEKNTKGRVTKY